MSSKTDQRAKEILRLLLQQGKTSIEELSGTFGTSSASVRRDLVRLEERGLVHRTHGGAMLAEQAVYEPFRFDASFQVREDRFAQEKQRIAQAAAGIVQEGETIGLNAGTTATQIARCLRQRSNLRIVTNAVNIGMELSSSAGLTTHLTGGTMRWAGAFSLIGPAAIESLNNLVMDRLFLGVCGVDAMRGATAIEPDEAAVFRVMTRQAKQVVVVADSSKVGMASPAVICSAGAIHMLITDDGASEEALAAFTRLGVQVMVV
ncbi:Transcriptional regulator of rhamnose utilization, DeoR family [Acidisarcina polymorpha]|uniref:Transcriptional regulator of rhamnose utilization, DeoR family n=1 Tax=Acidisarcina polymorpha TaxID=2211140 RepID=A0A2Z5G7T4_9BACT|nr:DeoR/GlpR family DNA-binding transcription regulator [Acidisarcina polymorpha]AXC14636.1 Transcriptional regulator of rhamnose utilization, DeoR family [Acidisarcina polymorpha]